MVRTKTQAIKSSQGQDRKNLTSRTLKLKSVALGLPSSEKQWISAHSLGKTRDGKSAGEAPAWVSVPLLSGTGVPSPEACVGGAEPGWQGGSLARLQMSCAVQGGVRAGERGWEHVLYQTQYLIFHCTACQLDGVPPGR